MHWLSGACAGPATVLAYLRAELRGAEPCRLLKLMVVGPPRQGKSALLEGLQTGKPSSFISTDCSIHTASWDLERPGGVVKSAVRSLSTHTHTHTPHTLTHLTHTHLTHTHTQTTHTTHTHTTHPTHTHTPHTPPTHTHTHHTHTTHTHTCWFLWFTGTLHRRNGFYTVQAVCAIALHLPYT